MKIGARTIKTGLSISLAIILSTLLIPENSPSLAGIAAVSTTMPSVRKSYEVFSRRIIANTIGGLIGVIMIYTLGSDPISIGIAAIIAIAILNYLNLSDVLNLAIITMVIIMVYQGNDNPIIIAVYRVLETMIGVSISFAINWLISPPTYDKKFFVVLTDLTNEVFTLLRATLRKNLSFSIMHRDLKWARNEYKTADNYFNLMRNEVIFTKKKRYIVARRLVVYRHMRKAAKAVIELLTTVHRHDHVYNDFPDPLRLLIRDRVETLMVGHEQILMKFEGRVSSRDVNFLEMSLSSREEYLDSFFNHVLEEAKTDDGYAAEVNGVLHIMSAIFTYEEELYDLNRILRIYRERYRSENEMIETEIELVNK